MPSFAPRLWGPLLPSGMKFCHELLETLSHHMVKTRSLYLTWSWFLRVAMVILSVLRFVCLGVCHIPVPFQHFWENLRAKSKSFTVWNYYNHMLFAFRTFYCFIVLLHCAHSVFCVCWKVLHHRSWVISVNCTIDFCYRYRNASMKT